MENDKVTAESIKMKEKDLVIGQRYILLDSKSRRHKQGEG
jgi:hypothetical protein